MITAILSLFGVVGVPAVVLGLIGKLGLFAGWLGGSSFIAAILAPVIKACAALIDILAFVLKWLLKKIMDGLDHILKSPSAVIALVVAMWVTWAWANIYIPRKIEKKREAKTIERTEKRKKPKRSFFRRIKKAVTPQRRQEPRSSDEEWKKGVWGH